MKNIPKPFKNYCIMLFLLSIMILLSIMNSNISAAVTEGFESGWAPFSTTTTLQTGNGWSIINGRSYSGIRAAVIGSGTGTNLIFDGTVTVGATAAGKLGGLGNISFWYRASTAAATNLNRIVQINIDGAGWSTIGPVITTTGVGVTTYINWSTAPNIATTAPIKFKIDFV
ncbi:MAG TPA: hypothetical protein PLJ38_11755, partial [bacterium]|nr:hypothetical protein [bacterium]